MPRRLIAMGASTGGLEAVRTILAELPEHLPAAVCIVIHSSPTSIGWLEGPLARSTKLPVAYAMDGEALADGRVYLAPPDRHLLVGRDVMRLGQGPRENRFRPAIDPLFRTAALAYGSAVIGVVLSGALDDGAAGLAYIKSQGGTAIVQDPQDAVAPGMPEAALRHVAPDHVAAASHIGGLLSRLSGEQHAGRESLVMKNDPIADSGRSGSHDIHRADAIGPPTPFSCPECGGALWEYAAGQVGRYQCHVGHRYGAESLLEAHSESVAQALWCALRALEENSELYRRMAAKVRGRMSHSAAAYDLRAQDSEERAGVIRRVLMPPDSAPSASAEARGRTDTSDRRHRGEEGEEETQRSP